MSCPSAPSRSTAAALGPRVLLALALAALLPATAAHAFTDAELRAAAAAFLAMPVDTATMSQLLGRPAMFSSGGPFNDLEFTVFNTD